MKRVLTFIEAATAEIAQRSAVFGKRVALDASILDRRDSLALAAPGRSSANGSCRLIQTQDGWIAANLPREDDLLSVPALLGAEPEGDAWDMLTAHARGFRGDDLVTRAKDLGMAIAGVGETPAPPQSVTVERVGDQVRRRGELRVVDFSSLWAGPLCGSVFAALGADVVKVESVERPDTTARAAPLLDQRLNGGKRKMALSLSSADGRARLLDEISGADVLITSARARALGELGLTRAHVFEANAGLVWLAITGHGWWSRRIAFGDDAAASGGLLDWKNNEPRFIGDAVADPLTGLAAANAALAALEHGGAFIDASLARTAAYVAALEA